MYRMKVITALKAESKDVARALKMYVVGEEDARRSREVDLRLVQQLGASMGFWYVRRIVFTIAPADEAKPLRSPPAERRPLFYPVGDVTVILPFANF